MTTKFRTVAVNTYHVLMPCMSEAKMAGWLRDEFSVLGVDVSQKTIYNWLKGRVEVPERAWGALKVLEGQAIMELEGLLKGLGGER